MNPFRYSASHGDLGRVFLVLPPPPGAGQGYRDDWSLPDYPWTSGSAVVVWQTADGTDPMLEMRRLLGVVRPCAGDPDFRIGFEAVIEEWLGRCRASRGFYAGRQAAIGEREATEMGNSCRTDGEGHGIWSRGGFQDA